MHLIARLQKVVPLLGRAFSAVKRTYRQRLYGSYAPTRVA